MVLNRNRRRLDVWISQGILRADSAPQPELRTHPRRRRRSRNESQLPEFYARTTAVQPSLDPMDPQVEVLTGAGEIHTAALPWI